MNVNDAFKAGVDAFKAGKGRAPALNHDFSRRCVLAERGVNKLLDAYLRGWDLANLSDGMVDEFPSVIALKAEMDRAQSDKSK